jgi:UDP-3-O-[3-hydroxymyristoyl] glucosamine N-acyltransferase
MNNGTIAALGDPRFFGRAGPFTLADVAKAGAAEIRGGSPDLELTGVATLQDAAPGEVAVLHNIRYADLLAGTRAGAVVISEKLAARVPPSSACLIAADPHVSWARIATLFHPRPPCRPGIHPSAVIDPTAVVPDSCEIGPLAVIGARAELGAGCTVEAAAVVGAAVVMGAGCRIGPLASVSHAILGDRVYVYAGARVGQEGFGFAMSDSGFITVPQLGRVILEDDVEIGANSTVDRGASQDTIIGAGSRIDNLVQIGHNVRLGRNCVFASMSGVSGSTECGDFVQVGAQAGLTGHLRIGNRARIGAQAGVMSDVEAGCDVIGSPALPVREFFRNVAVLRKLARKPSDSPRDQQARGFQERTTG